MTCNSVVRKTAAAAVLGLAAAAAACGTAGEAAEGKDGAAAPGAAAAAPARVVSVEVTPVATQPFSGFVQIVGTVEAERDVVVSAEESGVVRALLVEKGSRVRAGQPIARVDDGVLRAQYAQADAQARLAAETFERQRRLWEDEKIGTEIAFLNARYGAETARAGANVLRERLARTVIRAPIAGILDARMVEVGSMVAPGTPVARIVDVSQVKVSGGVPERYAGQVRRGEAAQVSLDALGGEPFTGRIAFVGASVADANRTFPVEVRIGNEAGVIKPGMVASVRVARGAAVDAVVVPHEAMLREEGGYVVYVAVERGGATVAEARPVVPGPAQGNQVSIERGLAPGDRVITVGQQQVAAGDRLRIVASPEGGAR